MQLSNIRVGIVTANFNNFKYFDDYWQGIISQTYKPKCVTYVDDASTDGSFGQLVSKLDVSTVQNGRFSKVISGIEFVGIQLPQNVGPAAARNVALKELLPKCDAIAIYDSDDIYYPNKIKASLEVMAKYCHVGLVYSDYDVLNMATNTIIREHKEIFSLARLTQECIVSNNSIMPASIFGMIGLYDESLFGPEDYDLWLRIAERAAVYHIPEALYKYRLSGTNLTTRTNKTSLAQHVNRVHQKMMERRNASPQK